MGARKLSREACEKEILDRLLAIQQLYKRYNPNGDYLSMHIHNDYISANNAHWENPDKEKPLDFSYSNGEIRRVIKCKAN